MNLNVAVLVSASRSCGIALFYRLFSGLHADGRRGGSCSFCFLFFCCSWYSRPAVRSRLQLRAKKASKDRPVQRDHPDLLGQSV